LENWQHKMCWNIELIRCAKLALKDQFWMKPKISTSRCQLWAMLLLHWPMDRSATVVATASFNVLFVEQLWQCEVNLLHTFLCCSYYKSRAANPSDFRGSFPILKPILCVYNFVTKLPIFVTVVCKKFLLRY